MSWEDELDVNDPALYSPRVSPTVQTADPQAPAGADRGTPNEPDFLYDETDRWNAPLDELPVYQPTPAQTRSNAADRQAGNPYARRRAPAQGTRQSVALGPAGTGLIRDGNTMVWAGGVVACFAVLFIVCVMFMPQLVGFLWQGTFINGEVLVYDPELVANYKFYRDYLQQDIIYPGVFVDGVHVGGMTVAQAEEALNNAGDTASGAFSVNIVIGNKGWTIDNTNVSATRNLQNVLAQAYAIGRSNTTEIIGTSMTPFRQRVDTVIALRTQYANLYSDATYDHDAVRSKIDEIAAYVTREPVDSQIESFNPNTRTFTFTEDQPGVTIDADALYREVIAKLDEGAQGATINVTAQITTPAVTKADMMNSFKLVAAFTTSTTSDKQRNNNINLACQAING
ncbi:MAG: hypothetical protein GX418_02095, partial [Clostridiales bacterium]|nr:hypothetical protein [Clostridiales bacterium]